jgi:hypothetical protein
MAGYNMRAMGAALLLAACVGCGPDDTDAATCSAVLTLDGRTYWGVPVYMPITGRTLGLGTVSACSDGLQPHRRTGMSNEAFTLRGFSRDEVLISRLGLDGPDMLWVASTGDEPPFILDAEVQQVVDDNPVPEWLKHGRN